MTTSIPNRWMALQKIAEYMQFSKDLNNRLALSGRIPAAKVGSHKRERIARTTDVWFWALIQGAMMAKVSVAVRTGISGLGESHSGSAKTMTMYMPNSNLGGRNDVV